MPGALYATSENWLNVLLHVLLKLKLDGQGRLYQSIAQLSRLPYGLRFKMVTGSSQNKVCATILLSFCQSGLECFPRSCGTIATEGNSRTACVAIVYVMQSV